MALLPSTTDTQLNLQIIAEGHEPSDAGVIERAGLVWDVDSLTWVKGQQSLVKTDNLTVTLPATAATAAKQDTGNASLASIDGKPPALSVGRVPVDGSAVTQPVSAASLPLPTGAATAANQPATHAMGSAIPTGATASFVESRGMVPKTATYFYVGADIDKIETVFGTKKRIDQFAYSGGNLASVTTTIVDA